MVSTTTIPQSAEAGAAMPQDPQAVLSHEDTLIMRDDGYVSSTEFAHPSTVADGLADDKAAGIVGWIAVTAGLAWTVFFVVANRSLAWRDGTVVTGAIADWSMPLVIVALLYLIYVRSSRRHAQRFVAQAVSIEKATDNLMHRIQQTNAALGTAASDLAKQTGQLEAFGAAATERLAGRAAEIEALVARNAALVSQIADTGDRAQEGLARLRDELPGTADTARDIAANIERAGRGAEDRVQMLISGFERLNTFGLASERQVDALHHRVENAIAGFADHADRVGMLTTERFDAVHRAMEHLRGELDTYQSEALGVMQQRASRLHDELTLMRENAITQESDTLTALIARLTGIRGELAQVGQAVAETEQQSAAVWEERVGRLMSDVETLRADWTANEEAFDTGWRLRADRLTDLSQGAVEQLTNRLQQFDRELSDRQVGLSAQLAVFGEELTDLKSQIEAIGNGVATLSFSGASGNMDLHDDIAVLSANLERGRALLDATRSDLDGLTDGSVRLLELLQATVDQTQRTLPEGLNHSEVRIAALRDAVAAMSHLLNEADTAGRGLSQAVTESHDKGLAAVAYMRDWQAGLSGAHDAQRERLAALHTELDQTAERLEALTAGSDAHLAESVQVLRGALDASLAEFDASDSARVQAIADTVGRASAELVASSVQSHATDAILRIDSASERALAATTSTASALQSQLVEIDALAGNLEQRVAGLRAAAADRADKDFSRRVTAITDNLNSAAIDISKVVSQDVSETAWAAYLKGDRGIFTRRAVRLLSAEQVRDIGALYDSDGEFREHVARYITDFENLLRSLLATSDGHALSVTVLGSDMGKLYVALAQATERLRSDS